MKKLSEIKDWKELINEVVQGDCLEGMRLIPDKSIDLILTDPPFEKEAHTLQRRFKKSGGVMAIPELPFSAITEETRDISSKEMARIAKKWILVFCQIEAAPKWRESLEKYGMIYKRTCIWVKPDGMPQYSGDRPGMGYETILAMHTPIASVWNGGGKHGVFTFNKNDNGGRIAPHPTTKPRELIRTLITLFSNEEDLIGDFFMGSWTTARACKDLGRNFIGFELEEKYCKVGEERLRQQNLF